MRRVKNEWESEFVLFSVLFTGGLLLIGFAASAENLETRSENSEYADIAASRPRMQTVVTYNTSNGGSAMREKVARHYRPASGTISIQANPLARGRLARPDASADEDNQEDSSE